MKIVKMETFVVPPRWLFLRLETDEGVVGWGEPIIEGRASTVEAAVEALRPLLIGADADRIEDIWQACTRGGFYRNGPILNSAVAGVDQALWDIKGKALGVPVYQLLGGRVRDGIDAYSWIGGDSPQEVSEHAIQRLEEGFQKFKMNVGGVLNHLEGTRAIDEIVKRATLVREAIGDSGDFAIDFHGRTSFALAKKLLKEMEDVSPLFVEEPLVPELSFRIGALCELTTIPIATGERHYSRGEFIPLLQSGVSIVQPDVSHAGGISETRRIAALAEAFGAALAPHCPLGPIALSSSLQIDFMSPNAIFQETSLGIHYNAGADLLDYVCDPQVFELSDGRFTPSALPGLGITVDENRVREMSEIGHSWTNPIWRRADGSLAEW
ncbi:galactonate dehydratase [Rhodococcus sp. T2V]|uniref:galactonate dehydratase n=1 Tax=Rhodococcus sp. T2V TaxID=3034164 RepID=UPI0023E0DB35|nr:galactonate dehydratase [Rhodococcus sp. T2V]MDF3303400.1 galactonate dehydratase [Rhodococcus sp. T2V]